MSEKQQAPALDTLPPCGSIGRLGMDEGRVQREARAPVQCRIKGLEEKNLVAIHVRVEIPALIRVIQGQLDFAEAVLAATLRRDEVVIANRGGVAQRQRLVNHGRRN